MKLMFCSSFALVASGWLLSTGAALAQMPKTPAVPTPAAPAAAPAGAAAEHLTFTNKLIDGKKVWEPLKATAKAGKLELTLVNTLADAHGFQIVGLSGPIVVGPKETKTLTVDAPKAGTYPVKCQLHPAHKAGDLTIN